MKAYVIEYQPRQENPRTIEVVYGGIQNTRLRYGTRQAAEAICKRLNSFEVRSGQHHCSFTVDSLPGGEFGVFCVCHPQAEISEQAVIHSELRFPVGCGLEKNDGSGPIAKEGDHSGNIRRNATSEVKIVPDPEIIKKLPQTEIPSG